MADIISLPGRSIALRLLFCMLGWYMFSRSIPVLANELDRIIDSGTNSERFAAILSSIVFGSVVFCLTSWVIDTVENRNRPRSRFFRWTERFLVGKFFYARFSDSAAYNSLYQAAGQVWVKKTYPLQVESEGENVVWEARALTAAMELRDGPSQEIARVQMCRDAFAICSGFSLLASCVYALRYLVSSENLPGLLALTLLGISMLNLIWAKRASRELGFARATAVAEYIDRATSFEFGMKLWLDASRSTARRAADNSKAPIFPSIGIESEPGKHEGVSVAT